MAAATPAPTPIPAFAPVLSWLGDGDGRGVFVCCCPAAAFVAGWDADEAVVEGAGGWLRESTVDVGASELKPAAA